MRKTLEMVHPSKYAAAISVAQKFTSKSNLRMMLQLVFHKNNGDLIATDSRHLIKVTKAHGFTEDFLVNTKSLEFAKGDYPETDNVFPTEHKSIIRLNQDQIKIWLQMHKSMNQMSKLKSIRNDILIKFSENSIDFELKNNGISFKLPFEEFVFHQDITSISYQVELMKNALEAHATLNSQELLISMSSSMKPILLDNQSDVQAIVLPLRVY